MVVVENCYVSSVNAARFFVTMEDLLMPIR